MCSAAWARCRGLVASFCFQPGWYPFEKHLPLRSAPALLPSPIFLSHYLSVNSTLREPKCWEEKNSIMFVLAFQLCEAFVPFFPLDLAPDFLEVAETGGLGCISRRSNVGDRWTDIPRAPSVLPAPSCPGSHSRLAGLEWRAPASWPPNPQLLLWQMGIPLFCPEGGQQ